MTIKSWYSKNAETKDKKCPITNRISLKDEEKVLYNMLKANYYKHKKSDKVSVGKYIFSKAIAQSN